MELSTKTRSRHQRLLTCAFMATICLPQIAQASVFVSGSGELSSANADLQQQDKKSGSVSVALGIGPFVRIGVTHQQEVETTYGYEQPNTNVQIYYEVNNSTHSTANSLDLTLILYPGELIVPYLKGGLMKKSYKFSATQRVNEEGDKVTKTARFTPAPTYFAGGGLGLRLNPKFTLNLGYTVSPGLKRQPGQDPSQAKAVLDKNTSVGLSYEI